ncbi:phage tail tape measure protein [Bradyrhizobium denitrificans]
MSDNNLDIRARLTGEDRMSSTVVKLLAKIKSLEAQMARLGKAGNSIGDIPMEAYVKKVNAAGKALNGLTQKHLNWAKANGVAGDKAQLEWTKLTNQIQQAQKEHEKWSNSTIRGAKKRAKQAQDELNLHYKNAQAFKYLYNKIGDQRLDIQRRTTEQEDMLLAAHLRNQEKRHGTHLRNIARMRQQAMQSMQSMANFGNRAIPYAAAATAATGYAGVSALRTRMRMDAAETNMQIFGGMTKDQVVKMRKEWGNADAIKFGLSPDAMMNSYTEVIKAGIPENIARAVTESILKAATGLEMDTTQTTKLAGTAATLFGDLQNLDPKKIESIMNAIAIAARDSRADADEIVAANKRGSSVLAMGMSMEKLTAFTSSGVSAGIQQGKAGTMMDHLVSELLGARFKTGKRGEDLSKAANLLGLGGKSGLSARMAADPTETLMKILEKTGKMKPLQQQQIAHLIGQDQWSGEFLQMVQVREKIREILTNIADPKNAKFNDEASETKMKSLTGRWKKFTSAFSLLWEAVGAGFEKMFVEVTDFFTDYMGKIDTAKITDTIEAFTDGIVQGLGYEGWTALLKATFGDPSTARSYGKEVGGFTKGFVTGMKEMWDGFKFVITGLMNAFGVKSNDPEALGKFTARIVEFGVALKAIGSFVTALDGIVTFVKGLAAAVAMFMGVPGVTALLSFLAVKNQNTGVPDENIKRPGETTSQWRERQKKIKELKRYKPTGDPLFQPSSYTGSTDFSGRRRLTGQDLADSLDKFTGKVELAAFRGGTGGLQNAFYGGGSGRGLSTGGLGGGGGGIGGLPALLKSTPGSALPGVPGGGIIRRDNIPSFNGSGGSVASAGELNRAGFDKVFGGTPLAGKYDQIVAAAKANGIEPALLASVMAQESGGGKNLSGNNPGGVMDPATGWSRKMQFADLDAGISKTASVLAKNYRNAGGDMSKLQQAYAPIGAANDPNGLNKNWLPGVNSFMGQMGGGNGGGAVAAAGVTPGLADKLGLRGKANFMHGQYGGVGENLQTITLASGRKLTVNAAAAESFKGFADELEASGYKIGSIEGYSKRGKRKGGGWSQHAYGNAIDINPGKNAQDGTGRTDMPANVRDMAAKYGLSWGGDWSKAYNDPMHFEWNGTQPWKQGITDGVPSSVIQNVPSKPAPVGPGAGMGGSGGGGPVQIHINGNSHDPEALATMVQRRIDESMNWRTHDTASEYT